MKRTVKLVLAVVLALCLGAVSLLGVSARGTEVTISRAENRRIKNHPGACLEGSSGVFCSVSEALLHGGGCCSGW